MPKKDSKNGRIKSIILFIVLFIPAFIFYVKVAKPYLNEKIDNILNGYYSSTFIIATLIVIAIIIGAALIGWLNSCPECKEWFCRRLDARNEIDRTTGYETITREDVTKDKSGKELFRTQRKEQVMMTYCKYMNHYSCTACGNKWVEISDERTEG